MQENCTYGSVRGSDIPSQVEILERSVELSTRLIRMANLKTLIDLSGEKQSTIAKTLGVSQPIISDWCNGKKKPSTDNAIAIARLFHVSVGCVVDEEPIPENYPNHWPPKPLQEGDPLPAYIGEKQVRYIPSKKPPFTEEQLAYFDDFKNEILQAIREDTSSSQEATGGPA